GSSRTNCPVPGWSSTRLRNGLSGVGAVDAEQRTVLVHKDQHFVVAPAIVDGFQFKSAIHAIEQKSAKGERSAAAWVGDALEPLFAALPVFDRGAHHGQSDNCPELTLSTFVEGREERRHEWIAMRLDLGIEGFDLWCEVGVRQHKDS